VFDVRWFDPKTGGALATGVDGVGPTERAQLVEGPEHPAVVLGEAAGGAGVILAGAMSFVRPGDEAARDHEVAGGGRVAERGDGAGQLVAVVGDELHLVGPFPVVEDDAVQTLVPPSPLHEIATACDGARVKREGLGERDGRGTRVAIRLHQQVVEIAAAASAAGKRRPQRLVGDVLLAQAQVVTDGAGEIGARDETGLAREAIDGHRQRGRTAPGHTDDGRDPHAHGEETDPDRGEEPPSTSLTRLGHPYELSSDS